MSPSKSLGLLLKEHRERSGMTLFDLAEKIGKPSIQFVCDVESGRRPFPPGKLMAWAKAVHVLPDIIYAHLMSLESSRIERLSGYRSPGKFIPAVENHAR